MPKCEHSRWSGHLHNDNNVLLMAVWLLNTWVILRCNEITCHTTIHTGLALGGRPAECWNEPATHLDTKDITRSRSESWNSQIMCISAVVKGRSCLIDIPWSAKVCIQIPQNSCSSPRKHKSHFPPASCHLCFCKQLVLKWHPAFHFPTRTSSIHVSRLLSTGLFL